MSFSAVSRASGDCRAIAGRFRALATAVLAFAAMLALLPTAFAAENFPALTGRVVDAAGIIDQSTEAAITEKLAAFEKKSSDQVVVATISSLEGAVLEDYANRLFRHWKLGQAQQDNGVLLLVALDDRKVRIEVGYGLEGTLTDALSKLIIVNAIIPEFRAGNYALGISKGVDDILTVLGGNAAELEARARRFEEQQAERDRSGNIFALLFFALFAGMFLFGALAPVFGRRIGPGRYRWLGMTIGTAAYGSGRGRGWSSGGSSWGGGGFSGGGGSSGGGGASGGW